MSSFVRRAAWAGFLVASVAGLSAALVTSVLAVMLLQRADDRRLLEAGGVLATEVLEHRDADLVALLDDETRETRQMGLSFALFALDGRRLAGSDRLPFVATDAACVSAAIGRACAVRAGELRVVVGAPEASRWSSLLTAALLSAMAVALLASLAIRPLARSLAAPLTWLSDRLRALPVESLTSADLGTPTHLRELEALREALRGLLARVDVSLQQAQRFASSAAHELRTPLTALKAELELALEGPLTHDAIARAHERTGALAMMVERLLVLATPSDAPLGGETVALDELTEDVIAALPDADRARVSFERKANLTLDGDETLLSMLVSNALSNALKFGAHVQVTVDARGLEVRDDGPGIEAADAPHLFEPLYRGAHATREGIAGHGLGLALIAHVARRHGGKASLVDTGSGARLRVDFTPRDG
jgi:signal transduction histidine kinase